MLIMFRDADYHEMKSRGSGGMDHEVAPQVNFRQRTLK